MRDAQDADVLAGSHTARHLKPLQQAVAVAGVVVAIDQLTKWWAVESLSTGSCSNPDACVELLAGIRLRLVFNTGAAFTTGSGYGPFLAVLAIVMTLVLLTMASRRSDRRGTVLLAAIAGGAVGNLVDRVFRADDGLFSGPVIDFIDVGWWPVFNVADSAIVVGVVAIIMLTFFEDRPGADEHIPTEDPAAERIAERAEPDPVSGDAVG